MYQQTFLTTESRPCCIDLVIVGSARKGRGLTIISRRDRTFEANKLFIIWLFASFLHASNRPGRRRNNALQLANQSARFFRLKVRAFSKILPINIGNCCLELGAWEGLTFIISAAASTWYTIFNEQTTRKFIVNFFPLRWLALEDKAESPLSLNEIIGITVNNTSKEINNSHRWLSRLNKIKFISTIHWWKNF